MPFKCSNVRDFFLSFLHKIRSHTIIKGNGLVDAAAKSAVTTYESLPSSQALKVDMGEIAPRLPRWVMYTAKPQVSHPHLGSRP